MTWKQQERLSSRVLSFIFCECVLALVGWLEEGGTESKIASGIEYRLLKGIVLPIQKSLFLN